MRPLVRKDIRFNSADGSSRIAGYIYSCADVKPFCILQISHGMCENIPFYEEFAAFMVRRGVVVCGGDHIGHGLSAPSPNELGHFKQNSGRYSAVQDLKTMNAYVRGLFPGLPIVLLGHSMGSFLARLYAVRYPKSIDGLLLSGTSGPQPMVDTVIFKTNMMCRLLGQYHRSKLVYAMIFGGYQRRIPNPKTRHDWISRNTAKVEKHTQDRQRAFRFTVSGIYEMLCMLRQVSSRTWAQAVPKNMPMLIFSGTADPLGNYGRGILRLYRLMKISGAKQLSCILYLNGRHGILIESNRYQVYEDVLAFLKKHFAPSPLNP